MSESEQDIGRSVRHGLALTGGADSLRHILEFTASIILARLLRPADFGIIAVVSSFMQISYVVGNFGMAGAVVQAAELNRRDMDTATVLSTSVAIALTVCMALIAPLAADFFSMQELTRVMPLMALQITLAGLASVPMALLRRDFRFGRLAVAESAAAVVYAATGITLAAHGYGVWSLVWAPLASSVSLLVGVLLLGNYRPALRFSRESLGRFWRFGGGLTLKNVFVYAGRNVDNFIVARLLGDAPTGIYNRAFNLTRMPQTRLVGLLYRVCFPAFCRLRNERERFHQWYIMATRVVAVSVTPLLLGLCAVAAEFTIGVLGEHWSGMILPLRILCISALVSCLHTLGGAAIEATGRVHYEVYTQSAYAVMIIAGWTPLSPATDVMSTSVMTTPSTFPLMPYLFRRSLVSFAMERPRRSSPSCSRIGAASASLSSSCSGKRPILTVTSLVSPPRMS